MLFKITFMLNGLLVYIPLSAIGLWRWSYWLVRIMGARLYKPDFSRGPAGRKKPTLSVITPVYNEDEGLFKQAMQSWINNGVTEIIAVIDKSNTHLIVEFERLYGKHPKTKCRLVVTPKPGKRAALCDGIARSTGDLIALVDSDTVWGSKVMRNSLPHFSNPAIGGVTVTQRIMNPNSTSNVLFDILLWTRYREEVPFLLGVGKAFNTLSGRTAIYRREALVNQHYDNLHDLRHEFFLNTRGISGDDKRLTHLILEQGWHISFVKDAAVYTEGMDSMKSFMKQRLRWTRNSWRADLRAIKRGWVLKHPVLAMFMIDRFVQPFFMLLGPAACIVAVSAGLWWAVAILIGWWFVSRFVRLAPYFRLYPKRLIYLPAYILYTYVNALVKIYALASVLEHSWATRWHKNRLARNNYFRKYLPMVTGMIGVAIFSWSIYSFVNQVSATSAVNIPVPPRANTDELKQLLVENQNIPPEPALPEDAVLPTGVKRYIIKSGDHLSVLADSFGIPLAELKRLNGISDPDKITVGQVLLYYRNPGTE